MQKLKRHKVRFKVWKKVDFYDTFGHIDVIYTELYDIQNEIQEFGDSRYKLVLRSTIR